MPVDNVTEMAAAYPSFPLLDMLDELLNLSLQGSPLSMIFSYF
jgi:hypothetical protein